MTTIAYRDGIMAADTLVTGGDVRRGHVLKIGQTALGSLVGVTGMAGMLDEVIGWLSAGGRREEYPKVPPDSHISGIVACLDGRVGVFSTHGVMQWAETEFVAVGSGNEIAMGAMAMGASAEKAVEIAAQFDVYTGGRITTLSLDSPSRPKQEA